MAIRNLLQRIFFNWATGSNLGEGSIAVMRVFTHHFQVIILFSVRGDTHQGDPVFICGHEPRQQEVDSSTVKLTGKIPLALSVFKGQISKTIYEEGSKILS